MPNHDAITYYARRAPYYEAIYQKPERQPDLAALKTFLQNTLAGKNVLEIACGTGYWTQVVAETAKSIHATDINVPMLQVAQEKPYPKGNVRFEAVDMYGLKPEGDYDALFGGFIWSHIPIAEITSWLDHLHRLLKPGSIVVFTDNNFVAGSNSPISTTDEQGNVFQERKLANGDSYQIIKNFPSRADFERILENRGVRVRVENMTYYWTLVYEVA